MSTAIWIILTAQIFMGGVDTLYHHELTEKLAWRKSQRQGYTLKDPEIGAAMMGMLRGVTP